MAKGTWARNWHQGRWGEGVAQGKWGEGVGGEIGEDLALRR